ncbi:MAG: hypothetical protein SNJ57_19185 [Cyanobacteriota bacterium]
MKPASCGLAVWMLRSTYPWGGLLWQLTRLVWVGGERRSRERLRLWRLWLRVDFANLLAIAIELAQPEFWVSLFRCVGGNGSRPQAPVRGDRIRGLTNFQPISIGGRMRLLHCG